jgi:hypothetical protein
MFLVARDGKTESYVTDLSRATHRQAVAQLSGTAKIGTPLCPKWVKQIAPKTKQCTVNAKGADDLSLATGKGPSRVSTLWWSRVTTRWTRRSSWS